MSRWIPLALAFAAIGAAAQPGPAANSVLLIAKPELADPNFRQAVVLVTQAPDGSTVGVILNRPGSRAHPGTQEPIGFGGPVMPEALVALFRSEQAPPAAFAVLKGVYLSMHADDIRQARTGRRLFAGFSGWMPGQLQNEMARDAWYVLPATEELVFRSETEGLWRELVEKVRGARTQKIPALSKRNRLAILIP